MPEITIDLYCPSKRPVSDKPVVTRITGTRYVHPGDIETDKGRIVVDVVPGLYKINLRLEGYRPLELNFRAKAGTPKHIRGEIDSRAKRLPTYGQLDDEQKRLLKSRTASGAALWKSLSDNQAATFFQVSYALSRTVNGDRSLSSYIGRIEVIGGAEIERRYNGALRRAVGWRMHVLLKPSARLEMDEILKHAGFSKDDGWTHPTHAKFGYTTSFRQKGSDPKLQLVLSENDGGGFHGADVDLDVGKTHRSAPHSVYRRFIKKFPDAEPLYAID